MKVFLKTATALFLALALASTAYSTDEPAEEYDYEPSLAQTKIKLLNASLPDLAERSLDAILMIASIKLRAEGHDELADEILGEWQVQRMLYFWSDDLGDHEPLSQWIDDVYNRVADKLDERILNLIRFSDIYVINYALPVVLKPRSPEWDRDEYRMHFVPYSGVVTYWTVNISCQVATGGIGSVVVCPLAGRTAEKIMVKSVGPRISDRVYDRANR